ncbi:MAG TPA: nucleotide exchange factor GrpE [Candidatus Paceibacterota bacterium]|nr:nucleotide exchange factor GrpE [Candidatus Paceibacterota bacterium]
MEYEDTKKVNNEEEVTLDTDDIIIDEEEGDQMKVVKKLRERLRICEEEKKQYLDGWQRSKADYANAKKDEAKNLSELEPLIREKILSEIIPVADNFDMAFRNKVSWEEVPKNWRVGIEGIYGSLVNTFSGMGLTQFGEEGEKFDPALHQAVETEGVAESEDGKILAINQRGYKYKNKVLRPAKVKVGVYKN